MLRQSARALSSCRTYIVKPTHRALWQGAARSFSTTKKDSEADDWRQGLNFDASGLKAADFAAGGTFEPAKESAPAVDDVLDPNDPPHLTYEHYIKLKGINFKDKDVLDKQRFSEREAEWDQKVEELRSLSAKTFELDANTLDALKNTTVPAQEPKTAKNKKGAKNEKKSEEEAGAEGILREPIKYPFVYGREMLMGQFDASFLRSKGETGRASTKGYEQVSVFDAFDPASIPYTVDVSTELIPNMARKVCIFCKPDPSHNHVKEITYTNIQLLHRFINERGMILRRQVTGNCIPHQRQLRTAIKRARIIGLLCHVSNFYVPYSFVLNDKAFDTHTDSTKENDFYSPENNK